MKGQTFCQLTMGFIILVLAICLFYAIGIPFDFITMFLLTLFTMAISIFFYRESNNISNKIIGLIDNMKKMISEVRKDVKHIRSKGLAQNIKTPNTFVKKEEIRRWLNPKWKI